jgi:hypothetical protein
LTGCLTEQASHQTGGRITEDAAKVVSEMDPNSDCAALRGLKAQGTDNATAHSGAMGTAQQADYK